MILNAIYIKYTWYQKIITMEKKKEERKRRERRGGREEGRGKREEKREKLNFKIWTASARKFLRFWFWRICAVNETGKAGHQREALIFPPSTPPKNILSDLTKSMTPWA